MPTVDIHDQSLANAVLIKNILRMLRPHEFVGGRKVRLGRPFDGGYVMIEDFKGIDAAYSIGINDDASWDLDVVARGIQVFQYDHTIAAPPVSHPLMQWRQIGLAEAPGVDERLHTLPQMLADNGHEASSNLILKCDVEGAEWPAFARLDSNFLSQFRQIVIEVHCFELFLNRSSQNTSGEASRHSRPRMLWFMSMPITSHRAASLVVFRS